MSGARTGTSSLVLLACVLVGCKREPPPLETAPPSAAPALKQAAPAARTPSSAPSEARGVGREACRGCHAEVVARYEGSQHDLAMQPAAAETVLGDFSGKTLRYFDSSTRFERDGDAFVVRTPDDEGKPRAYRVAYTFGVSPLQQYLVETAPGRLQALPVAWDSRPKAQGGQRWFHLQPEEKIGPGDPLFWTGAQFNWNRGCADCHSTALARGYDRKAQRYHTTYAEIDVSCEACHGPGSLHVERATAGVTQAELGLTTSLPKASERRWEFGPGDRIAHLARDASSDELERCAPCHSRRAELGVAGGGFHDRYRLSLLDEDLYFADGQVKDEVYDYGSFLQSKMAHAGVRCSDCHEPHGLSLRAEGNALCGRCHQPAVFDTPAHHFHPQAGPGARCVDCHMPTRVYMGIDARHDHRFGVPRPERSQELQVPEACTACHRDKQPTWAAAVLREHGYGKRGPDFAEVLAAARREEAGSFAPLAGLIRDAKQPAIVRATAVETLSTVPAPAIVPLLRDAVQDSSPLVRRAAAPTAALLPPAERAALLSPLLSDPVRSVRLEAVKNALPGASQLPPDVLSRLRAALAEYRADREANADSPGALAELASVALFTGTPEAVEPLYEEALALDPTFTAAYANLADFYRARGEHTRAAQTLERGLARAADPTAIRHALALARVRVGQKAEALALLARAHTERPADRPIAYTYAVALSDSDLPGALRVLEALRERYPGNRQLLQALVDYHQRAGHTQAAAECSTALQRRLAELR